MKKKTSLTKLTVSSFTTEKKNIKGGLEWSKINNSYCTACPPYECMA